MTGGPGEGSTIVNTGELARAERTSIAAAAQRETMDRVVSIEIVRVTERTAVAAAQWRGRGNERAADQAAVEAMWRELNRLPFAGRVVIGEGERDEAPMLYIGEKVGKGGPKVDIALDPLDRLPGVLRHQLVELGTQRENLLA